MIFSVCNKQNQKIPFMEIFFISVWVICTSHSLQFSHTISQSSYINTHHTTVTTPLSHHNTRSTSHSPQVTTRIYAAIEGRCAQSPGDKSAPFSFIAADRIIAKYNKLIRHIREHYRGFCDFSVSAIEEHN